MDISVVIPNYNGRQLLEKNIPKVAEILSKYTKGKKELIITDDASKDDSLIFLEALLPNLPKNISYKILRNNSGANKGFSGNVNKGVEVATGGIVILLNTDVAPHKDFLTPLLSHFEDEKVFAVGCMDESIEDGRTILRGRGVGEWRRGFLVHRAGSLDKIRSLWASGGSSAFRKSLWDKLGGLQELYNPFYWEDIDLSYRAQKAGYIVLFEEKSKVVHEHEEGAIKKHYSPFRVKKIAYRNQFFFTWLNATDTMIIVSHVVFLPLFLLNALKKKDVAFFVGFFMAIVKLPKVLMERKKIQSSVALSDNEVIQRVFQ